MKAAATLCLLIAGIVGDTNAFGQAAGVDNAEAARRERVAKVRLSDHKHLMPPRKADGRAAGGRAPTATDFEIETDLGDTWKKDPEQVDDDQLIDWSQNEETQTGEPVPGAKR